MKFDSYHPFINFVYFTAVIAFAICCNHPVFVILSYICAFLYSVKLNGIKQLVFNILLIPFGVALTLWYAYYNHFGVTNLTTNFIDNNITLEALVYGGVLSLTVASVIMLFSCVFAIFSTDKVIYLFGKVSPKLSLFLSILLRAVPRVKKQAKRINISQKGIGKGLGQGNPFSRVIHAIRIFSITLTWTLENFVESAASMKSRGYSLKGRTAFSIYRFDNRDRSFVIAIFLCLTVIMSGMALNQTNIYYNPQIVLNKVTPLSFLFYFAYAVLLLMPMALQIVGEYKFKRLQNSIDEFVNNKPGVQN